MRIHQDLQPLLPFSFASQFIFFYFDFLINPSLSNSTKKVVHPDWRNLCISLEVISKPCGDGLYCYLGHWILFVLTSAFHAAHLVSYRVLYKSKAGFHTWTLKTHLGSVNCDGLSLDAYYGAGTGMCRTGLCCTAQIM